MRSPFQRMVVVPDESAMSNANGGSGAAAASGGAPVLLPADAGAAETSVAEPLAEDDEQSMVDAIWEDLTRARGPLLKRSRRTKLS